MRCNGRFVLILGAFMFCLSLTTLVVAAPEGKGMGQGKGPKWDNPGQGQEKAPKMKEKGKAWQEEGRSWQKQQKRQLESQGGNWKQKWDDDDVDVRRYQDDVELQFGPSKKGKQGQAGRLQDDFELDRTHEDHQLGRSWGDD